MKTAVITGATGSIGTALVEKLICGQIKVYVVVRPESARIENLPKSPLVVPVFAELKELETVKEQIPEACDVFYHFAWAGTLGNGRDDVFLQNQNVNYTLDAVKLAKELGCRKFVGAGSQAEYGRVEGVLKPDTPTFPETGYGMAKLCAGQLSRLLCEQLGMEHVWVRILSVYGPRDQEKTMVMSAIGALLREEIPAFTAGEQQWDYLYSKDAANALYLIGEKGKKGRIYCLGSGQARPLAEYIRILRDAVDPSLQIELGAIPYGARQVMYLCADISALQQDTGFEPVYSFEEGIRQTVHWYQEEKMK